MTYKTYDAAAARADVLKHGGICTGIRHHPDGTYSLLYDPYDGAYDTTLQARP